MHVMNRYTPWLATGIFIKTLVLSGLFVSVAMAQTAAQQLSQRLTGIQSLVADFEQTVRDESNQLLQQSHGQMTLLRPGKLRWDTQSSPQQLIIVHKPTVWVYDIDLQQASKQEMQDDAYNLPALLLGETPEKIVAQFNVQQEGEQQFLLTPKNTKDSKSQAFKLIRLSFAGEALQQLMLTDQLGQVTTIRFKQLKQNVKVDATLFTFVPPAGVDLL